MPEVLRTLGRYDIVREIGRGGMAIVYLARQTDLDRVVALKELAAFHAADPAFAERFVRESRIAGSLSHPNIVTVHDFLEHEGTPYIAMEYVEGGSLRPLVHDLELAQIAGVLECILAGLAHAESRGIVHRDLKPENVMVTADGSVKIADFGIAKALNQAATSHLSATGTAMGTPAYMAPEQALAKEIGPWTDLYSTGVIAYELLVGRLPFDERETPMAVLVKQIQEPIPPPRSLKPDLDERLARWLERMLEKDPALRPRSAAEAWDELEEIVITLLGPRWRREARLIGPLSANGAVALATTPEAAAAPDSRDIATRLDSTAAPPPVRPTPPTTPVRPEPSRSRRRPLLAGLAVLLVLAGIVLAVVLVGSGDPEATTRPTTATTASTTTAPAPLPPIVEDIVFERQGDQVKSTIQTSGPEARRRYDPRPRRSHRRRQGDVRAPEARHRHPHRPRERQRGDHRRCRQVRSGRLHRHGGSRRLLEDVEAGDQRRPDGRGLVHGHAGPTTAAAGGHAATSAAATAASSSTPTATTAGTDRAGDRLSRGRRWKHRDHSPTMAPWTRTGTNVTVRSSGG